MWIAVFCAALLVAMIWLAAVLLVVRDRLRPATAPPLAPSAAEGPPAAVVDSPRWLQILLIPVGLVVGPPIALVLAILAAPVVALQFGCFAYHWVRFEGYGIPIPPMGPPEDA